jgi:hypothetical protein
VSIDTGVERVDSVQVSIDTSVKVSSRGSTTSGTAAIVHFGSVGRLCNWGLFERSKAT